MKLLLISGSLRAGSGNTALLRTVQAAAPAGVAVVFYEGMDALPHFNPDDDVPGELAAPVAELRAALGAADAIVFSTPEYAGALPGSFKNVLDWSVGGGETYGKPVCWISTAEDAMPDRGAAALASLRAILGYTGSDIVEAACVRIAVPRSAVGEDGLIADPATHAQIAGVITTLGDHVASRTD